MQLHQSDHDESGATQPDDFGLQRMHERLDQVARALQDLGARRETAAQAGQAAPSREAARAAIELERDRLTEIQSELDGLRLAMRNRGVIEQAKGMLMLRLQLDEDTAFEYLRTLSNRTNRKLVDVAADVVRTRAGESATA